MNVFLTTDQVSMYGHIVFATGEQFCTFQDGVFYWNFGMEDFVDGHGIHFDTKDNSILIEDAAWSDEQIQKVYSVLGYASYYDFNVIKSGSGIWMEKLDIKS